MVLLTYACSADGGRLAMSGTEFDVRGTTRIDCRRCRLDNPDYRAGIACGRPPASPHSCRSRTGGERRIYDVGSAHNVGAIDDRGGLDDRGPDDGARTDHRADDH